MPLVDFLRCRYRNILYVIGALSCGIVLVLLLVNVSRSGEQRALDQVAGLSTFVPEEVVRGNGDCYFVRAGPMVYTVNGGLLIGEETMTDEQWAKRKQDIIANRDAE